MAAIALAVLLVVVALVALSLIRRERSPTAWRRSIAVASEASARRGEWGRAPSGACSGFAAIVCGVFSATQALAPRVIVGVLVGLVVLAVLLLLVIPFPIVGQLAVRELVLREERPIASFRPGSRSFAPRSERRCSCG